MAKRAPYRPSDPMALFSLVAATLSLATMALMAAGVTTMF